MVVTYFCIPRKIIVTDTDIVLYNHGFKRKIPKCDILKARSVTAKDRNGLWRKFAVEGVWGYCGIYASKIHKNLYIYASQNKNWILIETERKNYIVSPENLDIIVVIKASMGAGNFKKQGWEWKREELTIKTHRTLLKN